ncbi:hypothetical protein [Gemmobacter denitrificans]|uniref:Uncharacterized protein n=1 Tax=Gemmobacter denitrificans TaxID=3123040 RepID=A0ABU8BX41_9RHOB
MTRNSLRTIEWEGEPSENDLWKLFSDNPDAASERVLFYSQLKPLLRKMRLTDETRYYRLYEHSPVPERPEQARLRVTVTQRNLYRVAGAMITGAASDAAIQYLGAAPS